MLGQNLLDLKSMFSDLDLSLYSYVIIVFSLMLLLSFIDLLSMYFISDWITDLFALIIEI
jgi:hypothetical protein